MNLVLLDTHALVWLLEDHARLGQQAAERADAAASNGTLLVSAITFWEMAMLVGRRRLALSQPVPSWRQRVFQVGIEEVPISGEIGIMAAELEEFPRDPADRIITATALTQGATLITADAGILGWNGQLRRHDARR